MPSKNNVGRIYKSIGSTDFNAHTSTGMIFNNAGIFPDKEKNILNLQLDLINQALLTNTIDPILVTQHFLPFLERSKDGARIINLSSKLSQLSSMTDTALADKISP